MNHKPEMKQQPDTATKAGVSSSALFTCNSGFPFEGAAFSSEATVSRVQSEFWFLTDSDTQQRDENSSTEDAPLYQISRLLGSELCKYMSFLFCSL